MQERRKKKKKKKKNGTSLRDLRLTDDQNSSEQEAKLIYAIRVTRGYQNSNFFFIEVSKGKGFSYTGYFFPSGHVRAILF